jgi:hypothetical protein
MKTFGFIQAISGFVPRASVRIAGSIALGALIIGTSAMAQEAKPAAAKDQKTPKDSYVVHQTWDVGGRIADVNGSGGMYNTLVNLYSGPRILGQTLEVHALQGAKKVFFDTLYENSSGYGGDPNAYSWLRMSKGKIYDFNGSFRRNRQYFDYNLFGNPLNPAGLTSNGYTFPQITFAPHLFNTVRRMTDLNLTLMPVSRVSYRASYNLNIVQGPTLSSIHQGADALLLQNWRNSTDNWIGGIDWKPVRGTTLTFEEHITHYKGNTSDTLASIGLLQLAGGTPVSLGFDNSTVPSCGNRLAAITTSATNPPTANATCNGFLQDIRIQPTRTIFPTELFRFQSSSLKNIQMTGRILYTGGNSSMPSYYELFNGLESRTASRMETFTGSSYVKRYTMAADFGIVWQISRRFALSEQFDHLNWRQPGTGTLSEVLQTGTSMAVAPSAPQAPSIDVSDTSLGQKTESNSLVGEWEAASWAKVSLGWRNRARTLGQVGEPTSALANGRDYTYNDHQNSGILNVALHPASEWRINGAVETGWVDNLLVPIAPRQFQQYQFRTTYKPKEWALLSGAFNDLERRNSQYGLRAHSRSFGVSGSVTPNEFYSLDLSFGYQSAYSQVNSCFGDPLGSQPADATQAPTGATCGNLPSGTTLLWYGTSRYNTPSYYGVAAVVLTPVRNLHTTLGYRATGIQGNTEQLNPRMVAGTLQSIYQTPYGSLGYKVREGWTIHGDYDYYGYGEGGPVGPTAPRTFHSQIVTMGLRYEH